jgi:hypothetical protein
VLCSLKDKHKLRKLPFLYAKNHKMQWLLPGQPPGCKGIQDKSVISSKEKPFPPQVLITDS